MTKFPQAKDPDLGTPHPVPHSFLEHHSQERRFDNEILSGKQPLLAHGPGWLKEYNNTDEWITGDSHLFDRTDNSLNSLLNLPPTTEESYESDASYMTGNGAASNAAAANQNMGGG